MIIEAPARPLGRARLAWLLAGLAAIAKSYLTAPDGQSYAPGRLFAFVTFVVAQGLVIAVARVLLARLTTPEQWMTFFVAVGGYQAGAGATCIALVLGMAPTDSGGKWWGRDASPPPPPTGTRP